MTQWTNLVLGVLRLGPNADYDRIHELANQHTTLRLMLGVRGLAVPEPLQMANFQRGAHLEFLLPKGNFLG